MTDKPLPDQEREAIARLMHRDGCDHSRETMIAWECRREADRLLDAGLRLDAARVAAPSDGLREALARYRAALRVAAPSDGLDVERLAVALRYGLKWQHVPLPYELTAYAKQVAAMYAAEAAFALAATEQPETDG
jgi:hypothetical protein